MNQLMTRLFVEQPRLHRLHIFFDLHQEIVLCYTQFKMYPTLKTHTLTKSTNFCKKNLEMKTNIFFISVEKKHVAKKSFSEFGGAHGRPLNTLKLFFWQNVNYFYFTLMKNTFAIISRFLSQQIADII